MLDFKDGASHQGAPASQEGRGFFYDLFLWSIEKEIPISCAF